MGEPGDTEVCNKKGVTLNMRSIPLLPQGEQATFCSATPLLNYLYYTRKLIHITEQDFVGRNHEATERIWFSI